MTTWHANETLKRAASFFKYLAIPSEEELFANFDRFAVAVNNPARATALKRSLRRTNSLKT
jgi:hypothetical protein